MSKIKIMVLFLILLLTGSYSASADTNITVCDQSLNVTGETYFLIQNISSPGTCLVIGADNITIDGAGFTILYSQKTTGYGITDAGGWDNINIKNVRILKNFTNSYSYGIYGVGMSNSRIFNVSINTTGGVSHPIYLKSGSNNNTISDSILYAYGTKSRAVLIDSFSNFTSLINNVAYSENFYSVEFYTGSDFAYIKNNIITAPRESGILLNEAGNYSTVSDNTIRASTKNPDLGNGIELVSSHNSIFKNNNVITSASSVVLRSGSDFNLFSDNTIFNNGSTWDAVGLEDSNSNIFKNNTITASYPGAWAVELYNLKTDSIYNNTFIGGSITGTLYDYAVSSATGNNTFINTDFTTRTIFFENTTENYFNFSKDGITWLRTHISATNAIKRTLINWGVVNLSWTDSLTTGTASGYYDISGLLPEKNYSIYDNGSIEFNLTTDSTGALPEFIINLTIGGDTISVIQSAATTSPAPTPAPEIKKGNIISPVDGMRYGTGHIILNYTVSDGTYWQLDGVNVSMPLSGENCFFIDDGLTDGGKTFTLSVLDNTTGAIIATSIFRVDTTAPREVTNLTVSQKTTGSITWTWTNPTNSDFNNSMITVYRTLDQQPIYINVTVPKTEHAFTAYGLQASTSYTLKVQTSDDIP